MGKVNRRSNKKNANLQPPMKLNFGAIKAKCSERVSGVCQVWQRFPRFHRWALVVIVPVFIGALMLPSTKELEGQSDGVPMRRDIALNLGNSDVASQVTSEPNTQTENNPDGNGKHSAVKRTDVVLDSADIKEDSGMKARGGMEDRGPAPERKPMTSKIYPINGGKVYTIDTATHKPVVAAKAAVKTAPVSTPKATQQPAGAANQWYSYKVPAGDTLANIFRNKGLPLGDLYAIAKVEGAGKPISRIQAGQTLRYRQNSRGEISGLQILGNGVSASYAVNASGRFYRQ
ncbi:LysM-like peptidoglycan-binding domain-containing protein [Photobacterium piscicola]|uniref:Opacity-associated protein A LysM-like domain protein n=1 Tax=Photobacterium piscicola TaxID=1378299 RepID=A0A1T5I3L1_9GAMM|nr:LysM-like peptidoglycan-binding domain-containing protein [Photobacterium piscicola]MEC6884089.1 LysM-like peptidoglycan-binding domain-containing protein [Photobacterium piscicola]SKC33689.1 Opacity-associated protein A LysM-like domain protein [Photobacterium piscicola]